MNVHNEAFLMLCSKLGSSDRPVLTGPQLRVLTQRVRQAKKENPDQTLNRAHLMAMGYDQYEADRILMLLQEQTLAKRYLAAAEKTGCLLWTVRNGSYPKRIIDQLWDDSPGCLWVKGDLQVLGKPTVAVVGSRTPGEQGSEFAIRAGQTIAKLGYTLVSGNAKGVDRLAQDACLACGGTVISVVADKLYNKPNQKGVLYMSENDFDQDFTAARALSRNRLIHSLGQKTVVIQSKLGKGGTWSGTVHNLKQGLSPVFCMDDGSQASAELHRRGATLIRLQELEPSLEQLPD